MPGVTDTGFYNQHFIRDIGLIQLFLGVAFGIGMIRPERRIGLWAAATLWLIAHAVFHLWGVAVIICSPSAFPAIFRQSPCRRSSGRCSPSGPSIGRAPREPHPPESGNNFRHPCHLGRRYYRRVLSEREKTKERT